MVFSLQAAKSGLDPTTANIIIGAVQVKLIILIIVIIFIIIIIVNEAMQVKNKKIIRITNSQW